MQPQPALVSTTNRRLSVVWPDEVGQGGQALAEAAGSPGPSAPVLEEVERLLASVDSNWSFDSFQLSACTRGHPLSVLGYYLFAHVGFISKFEIDQVKFARCVWARCAPGPSLTARKESALSLHMCASLLTSCPAVLPSTHPAQAGLPRTPRPLGLPRTPRPPGLPRTPRYH